MSAVVDARGVRQLDQRPEPDERITEEQVQDPSRLVRLLTKLSRDIIALRRRFHPRAITHWDRVVDNSGTTVYRFPHGFGGRVDWWVVDWTDATGGPAFVRHSSSDNETLAVVSYRAGTVSVRLQEAG